jgi:hypothetical protein
MTFKPVNAPGERYTTRPRARQLPASAALTHLPDALRAAIASLPGPLLPSRAGGHTVDEIDVALTKMDELIGPMNLLDRARVCLELGTEIFGDSLEARGVVLGAAMEIAELHAETYMPRDVQDADLARVVYAIHQDVDVQGVGIEAEMVKAMEDAIRAGGRRGLKIINTQLKRSLRAVASEDRAKKEIQTKHASYLGDDPRLLELRDRMVPGTATAAPGDEIGANVRGILDATRAFPRRFLGETKPPLFPGPRMTPDMQAASVRAWTELLPMYQAPRLEKAQDSKFHKLLAAIRAKDILIPVDANAGAVLDGFPTDRILLEVEKLQVYVLKHDWARAFDRAQDFDGGEIRLPSDLSAFELQLNGRHVIALLTSKDGTASHLAPFIETTDGWTLMAGARYEHGKWMYPTTPLWGPQAAPIPLTVPEFIWSQVRAICIALEAELAETEVIRAPHKLNQKRERQGKVPLFDYHVVDLSKRKRLAPAAPELTDPNREIHHRRMHFVRGHWRHYEARKTWIKWHLRGNPDLGYIDKEYRL